MADAASFLIGAARLPAGAGSIRQIMHLRSSIWKQPTSATSAALAPFSASGAGLIRSPFVCGSLFMRGSAAFAGNFALLFPAH
jgi:hypothetical protein